ncbi:hypothetical protein OsI_21969 [Oryza sativa Indica Group]|uniref:Uncharacterized protein n=1 Tax=Oryza sativa subsp. indica TaxID=39946 RepID=B8B3M7_ORYSI|nr:hypothetical protein OsI_21969 [Oryza sativa Indica Group]
MGLSRRFLNLIVDNRIPGAKSLRCIDLTLARYKLFNTTTPAALTLNGKISESERPQDSTPWAGADNNEKEAAATLKIGTIQLPTPIMNFRSSAVYLSWYINCIPLAGRKVLCTDQSGRACLFDADTRKVDTLPSLHKPKCLPYSIFIPSADDKDDHDDNSNGGGSVYIMDTCLNHIPRDNIQLSSQFEAFVYRRSTLTSFTKSWQCQRLPPPPFVCDPKYKHASPHKITSYAVVDGGSHICISVDGAGTYCLDTVKHTWIQIGEWTLPFIGKVEYVPELKLWFGICANDWKQFGAADLSTILSTMDSQPQLVGSWKELEAPQEWTEMQHPHLVNLGSGRFCVARFYHSWTPTAGLFGSDLGELFFTVLTGTDVVQCVVHDGNGTGNASCNDSCNNPYGSNGKVELRMIKHNSKCHMSYGTDGNIKETDQAIRVRQSKTTGEKKGESEWDA